MLIVPVYKRLPSVLNYAPFGSSCSHWLRPSEGPDDASPEPKLESRGNAYAGDFWTYLQFLMAKSIRLQAQSTSNQCPLNPISPNAQGLFLPRFPTRLEVAFAVDRIKLPLASTSTHSFAGAQGTVASGSVEQAKTGFRKFMSYSLGYLQQLTCVEPTIVCSFPGLSADRRLSRCSEQSWPRGHQPTQPSRESQRGCPTVHSFQEWPHRNPDILCFSSSALELQGMWIRAWRQRSGSTESW